MVSGILAATTTQGQGMKNIDTVLAVYKRLLSLQMDNLPNPEGITDLATPAEYNHGRSYLLHCLVLMNNLYLYI